jgi:histidinol phosphatase-like enzyme
MIIKAKNEFNIDLQHSIILGDKPGDIEAGYNAGIGKLVFVQGKYKCDFIGEVSIVIDLREAIKYL